MKVDFAKLDRAFNPRVMAVIGDKKETNYMWLRAQSSFKGKLYSVQIDPKEIEGITALGIENYPSVLDIPEAVDFAIVAVPRAASLRVLAELIKKGVGAAHFFTAGFSETGTDEGRDLERRLKEMAEAANFHIVGPNCMGIFSPGAGVRQNVEQYCDSVGPVGFISQSGNHAVNFAQEAHLHGIDINKVASYGNGTVLEGTDYLEYFARDPAIKVIGMYIEGVKDGPRFLRVLRETAAKKPVVVWKGGRSNESVRAINSHTGSLAIPLAIFNAAVRQARAVTVGRMEDLIDTLKALLFLPPVRGDRVAAVGGSGGGSVAVADAFAEAGMSVPALSKASLDEFASFWINIGGGYRNPVDTYNANRKEMKRILDILDRDTNTDIIVALFAAMHAGPGGRAPLESMLAPFAEIKVKASKPLAAIITGPSSAESVAIAMDLMGRLQAMGIPAFPGMERGALALRKAYEYWHMRAGH